MAPPRWRKRGLVLAGLVVGAGGAAVFLVPRIERELVLRRQPPSMDLPQTGSISGIVVDEAGPVADRAVQLYGGGRRETQTDAAGRFRFESLTPGRYDVAVPPSDTIELGDVALGIGVSVTGRAVNAKGQPVAGAVPTADLHSARAGTIAKVIDRRAGPAARSDGRFELGRLGPGTWQVWVRTAEGPCGSGTVEVRSSAAQDVGDVTLDGWCTGTWPPLGDPFDP